MISVLCRRNHNPGGIRLGPAGWPCFWDIFGRPDSSSESLRRMSLRRMSAQYVHVGWWGPSLLPDGSVDSHYRHGHENEPTPSRPKAPSVLGQAKEADEAQESER
jgi:hypothetical protein